MSNNCDKCEKELEYVGREFAAVVPHERWKCVECKALYIFMMEDDE